MLNTEDKSTRKFTREKIKKKARSQLRRQQSSRIWRLEMVCKYCTLDELITTRWDGWRYGKLEKNLQNQPTATPER